MTFLATTGALAYAVLGRLLGSTSSQEAHQALNEESRPVVGSDASIPLVNPYKAERWWFFLPVLGAAFGRAIFIAFAQVCAPPSYAGSKLIKRYSNLVGCRRLCCC